MDIARVQKDIFDFSDKSKSKVYVYKVTLKRGIKVLDMRDVNGKDFNVIRKIFPEQILNWLISKSINTKTKMFDCFYLVKAICELNRDLYYIAKAKNPVKDLLNQYDGGSFQDEVFNQIITDTGNWDEDEYYELVDKYGDDSKEVRAYDKKAYEGLKAGITKFISNIIAMYNNLSNSNKTTLLQLRKHISEDPFNVRQLLFDKLESLGYQGIQTSENSNNVSTDESYGIWDKNALDMISITSEE